MADSFNVAVVLSGCGFRDGSEIHESVLSLLAVDRHGGEYQCFAPDVVQSSVVDHLSGEGVVDSRNVLVEAARIARGDIKPLSEFRSGDFDVLILPGGFGAAANLCDFAKKGKDCGVRDDVSHAVCSMHAAGKPIGALCIAPVILAKLLSGVSLTVGSVCDVSKAVEAMGAKHMVSGHGEIVVDEGNKVVSTPCYMLDSRVSQIADGADALVEALFGLV